MRLFSTGLRNFPNVSMKMKYEEDPKFQRDVKQLQKHYPSLREDLESAKRAAIELLHIHKIDNRSIEKINQVRNTDDLQFYKIRSFACRSLKGKGKRSGIRVIYACFPKRLQVVFLEMYYKGDKENEDKERIKEFRKRFP